MKNMGVTEKLKILRNIDFIDILFSTVLYFPGSSLRVYLNVLFEYWSAFLLFILVSNFTADQSQQYST